MNLQEPTATSTEHCLKSTSNHQPDQLTAYQKMCTSKETE